MMRKIAEKFLKEADNLCQTFVKVYYPNFDYATDCYPIGRDSNFMASIPWPLDIGEGSYFYDINDVFVALYHNIPKDIVLEWYENHVEDYTNKETYRSINLYHYWRKNYDRENYNKEQKKSIEESHQKVLESSYLLDEALGQPRWTAYREMQKIKDDVIKDTCEHEHRLRQHYLEGDKKEEAE